MPSMTKKELEEKLYTLVYKYIALDQERDRQDVYINNLEKDKLDYMEEAQNLRESVKNLEYNYNTINEECTRNEERIFELQEINTKIQEKINDLEICECDHHIKDHNPYGRCLVCQPSFCNDFLPIYFRKGKI